MEAIIYRDLGSMDYRTCWDYQEALLQGNVRAKAEMRERAEAEMRQSAEAESKAMAIGLAARETGPMQNGLALTQTELTQSGRTLTGLSQAEPTQAGLTQSGPMQTVLTQNEPTLTEGEPQSHESRMVSATHHYLLFVEHPPVYTIGKSGHMEHLLINEEALAARGVGLFRTNRGGDITFHGPGQIVGYPILDLERFYTDIGRYLRNLEEVIIRVLAEYGIVGERSPGETGVWIEPGVKGRERKICAIGVRCSRWVTMHGFAFNVNTDLAYFNDIVPCGIQDKQVASLAKELGRAVDMEEVREKVRRAFEVVFEAKIVGETAA